jgi:hypothetical protein
MLRKSATTALLVVGLVLASSSLSPLVLASLGAQPAPPESNLVHLYASDFAFVIDRTVISAGNVEFEVLNISDEYRHEVWIYPIDERDSHQFHEMLDLKRTGQRASEREFIGTVVASSGEIDAGGGTTFTANLAPGVYEVACLARDGEGNVRTVHYDQGMFAVIAVRAPAPM